MSTKFRTPVMELPGRIQCKFSMTKLDAKQEEVDGEILFHGSMEGHGAVFNNVDEGDDIILPGAFKKTLKDLRKAKKGVPLMERHIFFGGDSKDVVGLMPSEDMEETDKGLFIRAKFLNIRAGQDARIKAKSKSVTGLSIGFIPVRFDFDEIDGKQVRRLQEVKLIEITMTVIPMNQEALVLNAKSAIAMVKGIEEIQISEITDENRDSLISKHFGDRENLEGFKEETVSFLNIANELLGEEHTSSNESETATEDGSGDAGTNDTQSETPDLQSTSQPAPSESTSPELIEQIDKLEQRQQEARDNEKAVLDLAHQAVMDELNVDA